MGDEAFKRQCEKLQNSLRDIHSRQGLGVGVLGCIARALIIFANGLVVGLVLTVVPRHFDLRSSARSSSLVVWYSTIPI